MTKIDTDNLVKRLCDDNTKGQEGLRLDAADAIIAMAEDNRRLREAGSNLAFASGALNIATDSLDHLTTKRENVLDALQAWERALAAPGDEG